MPGWKQYISVVAITTPVTGIAPATTPEWFAVVSTDLEEGIVKGIVKFFYAFPGPHQVFQRRFIPLCVVHL
ncbi:hypothetical protein D3C87_1882840 [compost metagenome]